MVIPKDLPVCIEEILMDSTRLVRLKTIQALVVKNEVHYWLNTDWRHADGAESIIDEKCETVCSMCGNCTFPKCLKSMIWMTGK